MIAITIVLGIILVYLIINWFFKPSAVQDNPNESLAKPTEIDLTSDEEFEDRPKKQADDAMKRLLGEFAPSAEGDVKKFASKLVSPEKPKSFVEDAPNVSQEEPVEIFYDDGFIFKCSHDAFFLNMKFFEGYQIFIF